MLFQSDLSFAQLVWSMMSITLMIVWLFLVFGVFRDILRSRDMSGVVKVLWVVFVVLLPYLGVLAYILVRGGAMARNGAQTASEQDEAMRGYIRDAAGGTGIASEVERLVALREQGAIDDREFVALKAKVVGAGSTL